MENQKCQAIIEAMLFANRQRNQYQKFHECFRKKRR